MIVLDCTSLTLRLAVSISEDGREVGKERRYPVAWAKAVRPLRSWEFDDHPLVHEEEGKRATGGTRQLT
jgi:hypothetical protein